MKKLYYLIVIVLISSLVLTGCLLSNVGQVPSTEQTKVKPTNTAGAEEVSWNLSGAVMPVPPWGLHDIPGSDTASKLIVNQPNGNVEVVVNGVMKGLNPNTEYTVCLSNAWSTTEKWNIVGDWSLRFILGSGIYDHDMTVTFQNMITGTFSGTGNSTTQDPTKIWDIQATSNVSGDTITLDLIYTGPNPGYTVHAEGVIGTGGTIESGTWRNGSGSQNGTWSSTAGHATKEAVGNGYPGQFLGQIRFTFTTDEYGAGNWHLNLRDEDFSGPGVYSLSVWVNVNEPWATILISNNFDVTVD